MKIDSSDITMSSNRTYLEKYERSENLKTWVGDTRPDFEGRGTPAVPALAPENRDFILDFTENMKKQLKEDFSAQLAANSQVRGNCKTKSTGEVGSCNELEISDKDKMKIALIESMIEMLTGKKIKISSPQLKSNCADCPKCNQCAQSVAAPVVAQASTTVAAASDAPERKGWGIEYDSNEKYFESEKMSFKANGVIKTSDGAEIKFSVDLKMSRSFMQEQNISLRLGDAVQVDPLVINFAGTSTGLTETKFSFDLDSNGKEEQISFVQPGSGFLALDNNNDGVINNGSELFGPGTGNGFLELAKYDEDKNGWIDENDSIFNKLRIWIKDSEGNDALFALGQKGIGAIYLGNADGDFSLKTTSNQSLGQIEKTGIFVKEDRTVGTVQQIDLTI